MVCTPSEGEDIPLRIVGKSKIPHSDKYLNGGKLPVPQTDQFNARFNKFN